MVKFTMMVAMLGLTACGPKAEQAPAADTAATAVTVPLAPADSAVPADSMARDTARTP